ncbi:MAG: RidA family protein [Phycisphaerae bacterium]
MPFERAFSGAPWEAKVGYCRALRAGNLAFVTGTAPLADDGSVFAPGDAYRQAARCLEIIGRALRQIGFGLQDVVRTRLLVTDIRRWDDFARAHHERVAKHPPCTMVEVKSLIDPAMLIEIEVDAVRPDTPQSG